MVYGLEICARIISGFEGYACWVRINFISETLDIENEWRNVKVHNQNNKASLPLLP